MDRLPLYCAILGALLCATAVADCSKPGPKGQTGVPITVNPPGNQNMLSNAQAQADKACDPINATSKCIATVKANQP